MPNSIMLSYNHKSAGSLVLKVNEKLQTCGYKTWIDVDNMEGSILSAMANAIEQSDVILVFITDEYCKSENCVKECEYASHRGKRIIPIRVNSSYNPTGAVGIIVSPLLYVDFSKNSFDVAFALLLKQIVGYDIKNPPNDPNYDCKLKTLKL